MWLLQENCLLKQPLGGWKSLQTNRAEDCNAALTELSCPQESQTSAVSAAVLLHFITNPDFSAGYKTPEPTETPSVAHRVCELWFRIQWVSHCAFLRVGSIWVCVNHPLRHNALASDCISCWLACRNVCQLAASRCLRQLLVSMERKINSWLLIRGPSDVDQSNLRCHKVTALELGTASRSLSCSYKCLCLWVKKPFGYLAPQSLYVWLSVSGNSRPDLSISVGREIY